MAKGNRILEEYILFKKLLEGVLKKHPELTDTVSERDLSQLDGVWGGFEKQLKDLPKEAAKEAMAAFLNAIVESLTERMPDIREMHQSTRQMSADLLGKWRHRLTFQSQETAFDVLCDFQHEVDVLMQGGMSSKAMDAEMKAHLKRDVKSRSVLIKAIEKSAKSAMFDKVKALLNDGHPANQRTLLMDTPLAYAYEVDRMDVVKLLIDHDADIDGIGWTDLHYAIVFGEVRDVRAALPSDVLDRPDENKLSAYELCAAHGSTEKLAVLQKEMARLGGVSDGAISAMCDAISKGDVAAVKGFLDAGVPPNVSPSYGPDSLSCLTATYDVKMLELLLDHGLDLRGLDSLDDYHQDAEKIVDESGFPKIVSFARALLKAGWKVEYLDEFERESIRYVTGAVLIPKQSVSNSALKTESASIDGAFNPLKVDNPFWKEMIRTGKSAFEVGNPYTANDPYSKGKATWCFNRFGQTTTQLKDGRWVQIGGEHEDHYDPDFRIFNDVVVLDGKGGVEVYAYPEDVFPPTDFHTATLFSDHILLIGSLGYQGRRNVGETQVFRLNLSDFSIEKVATTGECPGWISRHQARLVDGDIVVSGGNIQTQNGYGDNTQSHALRLSDMVWRKISE